MEKHPPNPEDQEEDCDDGEEDGQLLDSRFCPKGLILELLIVGSDRDDRDDRAPFGASLHGLAQACAGYLFAARHGI